MKMTLQRLEMTLSRLQPGVGTDQEPLPSTYSSQLCRRSTSRVSSPSVSPTPFDNTPRSEVLESNEEPLAMEQPNENEDDDQTGM